MAEEANEDSWLYGTGNLDLISDKECKMSDLEPEGIQDDAENLDNENSEKIELAENCDSQQRKQDSIEDDPAMEMEEQEQSHIVIYKDDVDGENLTNGKNKSTDEDYTEDSDDDDDDINIVIGRIKTGPVYPKQRQNFLVPNVSQTEKKNISGKFSIEEFESLGSINGVSVHEFSIDSLDEKPWRKPGADITDYFNYGFNEDTWRAYCERQKRIRINESGVGLQALTAALTGMQNTQAGQYNQQQGQTPQVISSTGFMTNNRTLTPISNTDKYSGQIRGRGTFPSNQQIIRENTIQVMTAECRDYSKLNFVGNHDETFFDNDGYNYGFEPTQDLQWLNQTSKSWQPTGIKELTLDPGLVSSSDVSNQSALEINQHTLVNSVPARISPSRGVPRSIESLMLPPKTAVNRDWNKDWERDKDTYFKDRERDIRSRDKDRVRERESIPERERYDRDKNEREWNRDRDRTDDKKRSREKSRERNKEKLEESDRTNDESREKRRKDRGRERERERERSPYRSSRSENSRAREKTKRRSRSYEKGSDRKEKRDKKKSKEKNGSE